MATIKRLDTTDPTFDAALSSLLAWDDARSEDVQGVVQSIIRDVRVRGDAALVEYTNRFDQRAVSQADELEIRDFSRALASLPTTTVDALRSAAARITDYHQHQRLASWEYTDAEGVLLGQQINPLDRAGIYVPGGKAAYPSSVLMNALPAKVAGVGEIIMVAPAPGGEIAPIVLAAAAIAGVDRMFTIGGAQAVAALAYGTATVPAVDKIVGPGNQYVATAKAMVFGKVGIDMIAGPSEILIICDGNTDPDWIAMDLFSQAEHDEEAQSILLSPDAAFLDRVAESIDRLLPEMARSSIIKTALAARGALRNHRSWPRIFAMQVPSSSAAIHLRRWGIIVPARTTCCRPRALPAFPHRLGSTISRSAPRSSVALRPAPPVLGLSRPPWPGARALALMQDRPRCGSLGADTGAIHVYSRALYTRIPPAAPWPR
jgi:histidinol dehydrogenase